MIVRFDRLAVELPPPSTPDPDGASVVQELMGGKFGEMSTFMNYTFQSFNFRSRQQARPFFDLVSNIAAEEFGHIEVVAATINSMMTGASPTDRVEPKDHPMAALKSMRNAQQYIVGGHGALPTDSMGNPWTGANMSKLFPSPRIATDKIPECKPYIKAGEHTKLYRFSPTDYHELAAVWNGNHPETGDPLVVVDTPPQGFVPTDLPAQPAGWAPDYAPEEIAEIAKKLRVAAGLGDEPTGEVITPPNGMLGKVASKLTP